MTAHRESKLALVLVRLKIDGEDFLLLREHEKWGDWSLVGGHVEPNEELDWSITAIREADEELLPLSHQDAFEILPLTDAPIIWGPTASRSAGGQSTVYQAKYYALKLTMDPIRSLAKLSPSEFRLVKQSTVESSRSSRCVSVTLEKASEALAGGLAGVPHAWPHDIRDGALPFDEWNPEPCPSGHSGAVAL